MYEYSECKKARSAFKILTGKIRGRSVMLITLPRRTVIYQSVAEVYLTGVAPLGAPRFRFNFN